MYYVLDEFFLPLSMVQWAYDTSFIYEHEHCIERMNWAQAQILSYSSFYKNLDWSLYYSNKAK